MGRVQNISQIGVRSVFPLLAQQLDHECDPTKEVWGLPWGVRKFSALTGEEEEEEEFIRIQWIL